MFKMALVSLQQCRNWLRINHCQGNLKSPLSNYDCDFTFEVGDEHAELCAPVADVVEPEHVVSQELDEVGDGVADDGRPEVPHVHLLGDVGRRVVDDGALPVNRGSFSFSKIGKYKSHSLVSHTSEARTEIK